MKKVNDITIGGMVFAIEVDAYEKIRLYLDEIGDHFKGSDDSKEILADIEMSISEKFARLGRSREKAISVEDVQNVIKDMGDAAQIDDSDDHAKKNKSTSGSRKSAKKFYRDSDNKILGGVSSGIAAYFGIDVLLVRVLLIIVFIFTGFFPVGIIYIILWILVSEALTASQKLEMRGEPVTIDSIRDSVKNGINSVRGDKEIKF